MKVAVSNVTNPCTMSVMPLENPFLHSNFIERYVVDLQGYQESLLVRVKPTKSRIQQRLADEIRKEIKRAQLINQNAPLTTYRMGGADIDGDGPHGKQ